MGRPQHRVRNNSSGSLALALALAAAEDVVSPPLWAPRCAAAVRFHSRGGREDEQARQSGAVVVLEFEFEFRDMITFTGGLSLFVPQKQKAGAVPQPQQA